MELWKTSTTQHHSSMKHLSLKLGCLTALGLLSLKTQAAKLTIEDGSDDKIKISADDFTGGLSVNGTLVQTGLGNPGSLTVSETTAFTFRGIWELPPRSTALVETSATIYFVEASDPTQVSDIFTYTVTPKGGQLVEIDGTFQSDSENNLGTLPSTATNVIVEDGKAANFTVRNLSVNVRSDLDAVPEPGSLAVATIMAFGAFGCLGRRYFR
jgi:hypothetical protein